VVGMVRGSKKK